MSEGGTTRREAGRLHQALELAYGGIFWVIAMLGLPPPFVVILETRGRRSGKRRRTILITANLRGDRYLVSVLGEASNWVRNVRAAGGHVAIRHGRRREASLEEVPTDQRAPILKAYLKWALGARPIFGVTHSAPVEEFEGITARHPVFRIVTSRP